VNYLFGYWYIFDIFDLFLLSNIFSGVSSFRYIFGDGSLNWYVFSVCFLLWDIFSLSGIVYLWNIFSLVFNGVIVGILFHDWYLFDSLLSNIFSGIFSFRYIFGDGSLNWYVFNVCFLLWDIFSFGDLFIILIFSLEWDIFEL